MAPRLIYQLIVIEKTRRESDLTIYNSFWYSLPLIIVLLSVVTLSLIYHYWKDHHYMITNWEKLFSDAISTAGTSIVKALVTGVAILVTVVFINVIYLGRLFW